MAYVSISRDLKNDVSNSLDRLANAEKLTLGTFDRITHEMAGNHELRAKIHETLWGDLIDLEPRLSQYSAKNIRVDLQIPYIKPDGTAARLELQANNFDIPCFRKHNNQYGGGYLDLRVSRDFHPLTEKAVVLILEHDECHIRWNNLKQQILTFLEECKSLNEGIKLWPDLRKYIPADYLARVDAKVDKSASAKSNAAEALKSIDMDALQTSVVLARMAGAKL